MKIGILTFWKTEDNYGQLLQCYATQTFLRSLGHETFLVKATNGLEYNPTLKEQLFSKLRTAYRLLPYPWYLTKRALGSVFYTLTHGKLRQNTTNRHFEEFRLRYLNCTQQEYTLEKLRKEPPLFDAFIVGSDQIWNTTDGIYFLSWANENVKKLSIAASFGSRQVSKEFTDLISPWLRRFDLITVREESGLEICREAGIDNPRLVPDPTLLLTADDYLKISTPIPANDEAKPYIFIYFLGTRTNINWKEIHDFARKKGLKIRYVGSQGQEDKFRKEEPAIQEWLSIMANAEYVITNSFHGTVFALLFQKKFMVFPVTGVAEKMNGRLTTLLKPLGLDRRIYAGHLSEIDKGIDYKLISDSISKNADKAKDILSKGLD